MNEEKNTAALLPSAYLPPVQWFTKLLAYSTVYIEIHDHYSKQSYRNRAVIRTEAGEQVLSLPVSLPREKAETAEAVTSSHGSWQRLHFQALASAYERSPYFEYYADDFLPFYSGKQGGLADFSLRLVRLVCSLLGIDADIRFTRTYIPAGTSGYDDFRSVIDAKHPQSDPDFTPEPYIQMFSSRYGFAPNLSIADLLFDMGPEGLITLIHSSKKARERFPGI